MIYLEGYSPPMTKYMNNAKLYIDYYSSGNEKKMIVFDLDGTLLTSSGIISSATKGIIKHCKLKGYLIGYITARSRSKKVIHLLHGLPCDFIAFYNGALIYAEKKLLDSNTIPFHQAKSILLNLSRDHHSIIIDVNLEPWTFSNTSNKIYHRDTGTRKVCNLDDLPNIDVQRIRLKSDNLIFVPLEKYINEGCIFYHTISGDAIIVHERANKSYAAKSASNYFGIPTNRMIAFGDDTCDIDLFNLVGTGVAMGNAIPELKTISNYVTETNDNDGIALWISKYLIK